MRNCSFITIDEKITRWILPIKVSSWSPVPAKTPFFILPDIATKLAEGEKRNLASRRKLQHKERLLNFNIKKDRIHTVQQLLKHTPFDKDVVRMWSLMDEVKIVDEQTGRIMEGRRYSDGLHQALEARENVKIEAITQTYATITLQNYFRMYHKLVVWRYGRNGSCILEHLNWIR